MSVPAGPAAPSTGTQSRLFTPASSGRPARAGQRASPEVGGADGRARGQDLHRRAGPELGATSSRAWARSPAATAACNSPASSTSTKATPATRNSRVAATSAGARPSPAAPRRAAGGTARGPPGPARPLVVLHTLSCRPSVRPRPRACPPRGRPDRHPKSRTPARRAPTGRVLYWMQRTTATCITRPRRGNNDDNTGHPRRKGRQAHQSRSRTTTSR